MNTDPQALVALDEGIDLAELAEQERRKKRAAERQQVTQWHSELKQAREFDRAIRRGYARDRRYARGDSGFEVSVNIIGANIDTMVSFIYARDPDVDAIPSQMVEAPKEPPPQPPEPPAGLQGMLQDPTQLLLQGGGDIEQTAFGAGANLAQEQAEYQQAMAEYEQAAAMYQAEQVERRRRRIELALFAQTIEVVVSKLWRKARLKRQARRAVRSAMTTGIGWLKISWQERTQRDPLIQQQINDLQDNLRRIARIEESLADPGGADDMEAKRRAIEQQMAGLREQAERVIARGLAIDFVAAENVQVAPGVEVLQYLDAPWMAERVFMTISDAAIRWPDVPLDKLRGATRWQRREPNERHEAPESEVSADEADQYVSADAAGPASSKTDGDYICVWERWSLDDGLVYRSAEGLDFWLDEPAPPNVMSGRFYGYFPLAMLEVDGERSPDSLTNRSWKLQNEYNRTRTAFAEMRRRSYPGILFDEGDIEPSYATKLTKNARQEFIGIKTVSGRPVAECFAPKPVAGIDPGMVDTAPILRDLDRIWGIQEALQGSVEAKKTATEAEIQQSGFHSRAGSMRDMLEDWLGEIARYTATAAAQKLDHMDVLQLAGPDAVWPQMDSIEELEQLIDVDIRAGSSGKPNTRGEREAWQVGLPMLQEMIAQVGQLRGSSPSEIADKLEALVEATFEKAGDRVDVGRFLPQHEGMAQSPPQGGAPMAPQLPAPGDPLGVPPTTDPMMMEH